MDEPWTDHPGAELVREGLASLARGHLDVLALLVAVGAPRLRRCGVPLPPESALPSHPELALYRALGQTHPSGTHSYYNGLIRRLVSFERALEARRRRVAERRSDD